MGGSYIMPNKGKFREFEKQKYICRLVTVSDNEQTSIVYAIIYSKIRWSKGNPLWSSG